MSKRELSEPEKFFIENHYLTKTAEEIATEMGAKGVGEKTVQAFIEELPPLPDPNDTMEERKEKLQKVNRDRTGKMFARDDKKRAVMMTPGASEMADANREKRMSRTNYIKGNKDKLHVMDKDKPVQ